jgi:hypothetical protein
VRSRLPERPALPENLSSLWKTDLLLGGASVLPTEEVRAVVTDRPYAATAWVSASLKYRSRQVTARAGLHLGIETAFTVPGRRPLTALIREVQEMPVLTLPLDGAFVSAFNRANASVVVVMRSGLAGHLHPAHATDRRIEQYGSWFGARRTQPVVDIADELLTADPELFTVGDRAVADAADLIAGRDLGQRARRRPLAAVPQARAS